jgi:nuclear pore complex protein Nup107
MVPILDNDFLSRPDDENEATVLDDIRNHYIPEVVLAYNSALWFAGHYVSRTWLVECMTLAQVVAETPMLTAAFVASGRMKELVRAFAVDSQALLQATEQSGASSGTGTSANRAKKIRTEKGNADIWKVSWKEDYKPLDLEAID